jgi:transposase-like protein
MKHDIKKMRYLYDQWQSSGLGKVAFCRQHGVRPNTFHYWIKKFRAGPQPPTRAKTKDKGFSQIPIAHPVEPDHTQKAMAVVNFPSGTSLELFYPAEASFLKELLQ